MVNEVIEASKKGILIKDMDELSKEEYLACSKNFVDFYFERKEFKDEDGDLMVYYVLRNTKLRFAEWINEDLKKSGLEHVLNTITQYYYIIEIDKAVMAGEVFFNEHISDYGQHYGINFEKIEYEEINSLGKTLDAEIPEMVKREIRMLRRTDKVMRKAGFIKE